MNTHEEATLLRIFISSTDKFRHKPLYEVIVYAARRYGLAGATVMKGLMGYGGSSMVYSPKIWEVVEKAPLVIEIIDQEEKIADFLRLISPYFEKVKSGCIVTTEKARIIFHKTA